MRKTTNKIFERLGWDDWVFVMMPVVILTPIVVLAFCIGDTDTAAGLLFGEIFFVVLFILARTLHDKMYG